MSPIRGRDSSKLGDAVRGRVPSKLGDAVRGASTAPL